MNSNYIGQTPQTIGTVVMAGMLASTFLPSHYNDTLPLKRVPFSVANNYTYAHRGSSLTNESSNNMLTRYNSAYVGMEFEAIITSFFQELSSSQEPLGSEFEQILFENLWNLYQS